jgi:hypothetical protein
MPETPITKKMGMKPGQKVLILNAPEGYLQMLEPLPAGVEVQTLAEEMYDFIQAFCAHKADVDRDASAILQALKPDGLLWLTYPKKSSKITTDISRDVGWDALLSAGWQVVSLVAIDETWAALRFRPVAR